LIVSILPLFQHSLDESERLLYEGGGKNEEKKGERAGIWAKG
jgi:hypothetical protein